MKLLAFSKKLLFTVSIGLLSFSAFGVDYHSNPALGGGNLPAGQRPNINTGNTYTVDVGFSDSDDTRRINMNGATSLTVEAGTILSNTAGVTVGAQNGTADVIGISNAGTIGDIGQAVAINLNVPAAAGGVTTIINTGSIIGRIALAGQDDVIFINGGLLNSGAAANALSTEGAGTKTINLSTNLVSGTDPRISGNVDMTNATEANINIGVNNATSFTSGGTFTNLNNVIVFNNSTFTLNHTLEAGANFAVAAGSTVAINANVTAVTYLNQGTTTLNADLNAAVTNVVGGVFNVAAGGRTITGNFTNNGALSAAGGTITGALTNTANATFTTTDAFTITAGYTSNDASNVTGLITGPAGTERLTVGGGANVSNSTIRINRIDGVGGCFPRGNTEVILIEGGALPIIGGARIDANFAALSFSELELNVNNVVTTVTRVPFENILGDNTVTTGAATVLTGFAGTTTGDLTLVISQLDAFTNQQIPQLRDAIESLVPNTDSLPFNQARNMQGLSFGVVEENLTALATAELGSDYQTGYVAGGHRNEVATWLKPFGNLMSQKRHKNNDGYKGNTYGLELGVDARVQDDTWVGVALSVASSKLDTKAIPKNTTDAMSYQAMLYGRYSPDDYFVDGFLALARNQYKSRRRIKFGTINRVARSKFHAYQPSAKVRLGYNYREGDLLTTPLLSLQYTLLNQSKYMETGADTMSLRNVDTKNLQALEGGVGVDVAYKAFQEGETQVIPTAHLLYTYDFKGDRQVTTANFTGGGASFTTQGSAQARTAIHLGAGVAMLKEDSWRVSARYDFESKSGFRGHSLWLNLRALW